jgi:hypothetical protein
MAKPSKKAFFGGFVAGAVVAPIVLFAAGWVVTSGASKAAVRDAAQDAVVEHLAPICMMQFSKTSARSDQLAKLKALSQWDRPDFVTRNGWATMPGADGADNLVARECARRLAELEK